MLQYMAIYHRPTGGETFGFEEAHHFRTNSFHHCDHPLGIFVTVVNPPTIM